MKGADGKKIFYGIGLSNDQLKRDAAQASATLKGVGDTSIVESARIDKAFNGIGGTIAKLGVAFSFAQMARELYKFAGDFERSMKEVTTISQTVTDNLDTFKRQILEMSGEIPIGADEAAKALYQIVSAGHDGADGMEVLRVSAKAAVGGVTQTVTAADAITTMLNAYKKNAGEAESISDQLFLTAKLGKTTMGELGQSIAQVAPIAASFGIETEQVLAAVATLTKSGTPTAQAMTQIRASIIAASKVLGDGYFATHTYQEGLSEIARRAGGSEAKLRELVPEIEGMNGVLGLTGLNAKMAASDLSELGKSAGATEEAFKKMSDESSAQLTMLKNNILKEFAGVGEGMTSIAGNVAKFINDAFDSGAVKDLSVAIASVGGGLLAYKVLLISVSAYQELNNRILQRAVVIRALAAKEGINMSKADAISLARNKALTASIRLQTKALLANAKAMLTNPYVLAGAAVAALTYGIYKLVTAKTAEERAHEAVNKRLDEQKTKYEELLQKVDQLKNAISDTDNSDFVRADSYMKLKALYPEILSNMSMEQYLLSDMAKSSKAFNEATDKRRLAEDEKAYADELKEVARLEGVLSNLKKPDAFAMDNTHSVNTNSSEIISAERALREAKAKSAELKKVVDDNKKALEASAPAEVKLVSLKNNIKTLDKEIATIQSNLKAAKDRGDFKLVYEIEYKLSGKLKDKKELENEVSSVVTVSGDSTYGQSYRAAQKEWQTAKRELQKIEADKDKFTQKQYEDAKTRIDTAEKNFKALGGNTSPASSGKSSAKLPDFKTQLQQYDADLSDSISAWNNEHAGEITLSSLFGTDEQRKQEEDELIQQLNDYLLEYGTAQEKMLALEQSYAHKKENVSGVERMRIEAEEKTETQKLYFENLKKGIDFTQLFGNLDQIAPPSKKVLYEKIKKWIDEAGNSLSPEDLKSVSEAFNKLELNIADQDPFSALKNAFADIKTATDDTAAAQEALNKLIAQGQTGTEEYAAAEKKLTEAQNKEQSAKVKATAAIHAAAEQGKQYVGAANDVIGMLEDLGISVDENTSKYLEGTSKMLDGLAEIDLTKPGTIITGGIKMLSGAVKQAAAIFGWFKGKKDIDPGVIEYYNTLKSVIQDVVAQQKEVLNNLSGSAAKKEGDDAVNTLNMQIEATRRLAKQRSDAGSSSGSHSYGYRTWRDIRGYESQIAASGFDMNAITQGAKNIKGLIDMSGSDLRNFRRDNIEVWAKLDSGIREYLETIIATQDEIDKLREQTKEAQIDLSFNDAYKGMKDMLLDVESTSEDVSKSIEDNLRNAIVGVFMDKEYQKDLEAWYNDFAAAFEDDALSGSEADALKSQYEKIYSDAKTKRDALFEAAGISFDKKDDDSREASSKGIATASQDSVDENNARLTTIQLHTYNINENVNLIQPDIAGMRSSIDMMRDCAVQQLQALNGIRDNTAPIAEMKSEMVYMRKAVESIRDKGVTMK